MHIHTISSWERIILTRADGTATGRYQRRGEKGWETVVQKSFGPDSRVNIIEELKKEVQKVA